MAWQRSYHLNSRVCAISETATAVQEEEFRAQKPRPILEHKVHMLASVLAVWRKLRDELQEKGAVQTAAQQRRSLNRMVEKLEEVKSRMEASEAAHKVVHPLLIRCP